MHEKHNAKVFVGALQEFLEQPAALFKQDYNAILTFARCMDTEELKKSIDAFSHVWEVERFNMEALWLSLRQDMLVELEKRNGRPDA